MNQLKRLGWDVIRLAFFLACAWYLIKGDFSLSTMMVSTGYALAIAAITHVSRRVFMPRLDIQVIALQAAEHPIGAAIVFAAVVCLMTALINLQGGLLLALLGK